MHKVVRFGLIAVVAIVAARSLGSRVVAHDGGS